MFQDVDQSWKETLARCGVVSLSQAPARCSQWAKSRAHRWLLSLSKEETHIVVSDQGESIGQQYLIFLLLHTTKKHAGYFQTVMSRQHEGLALLGSTVTLSFAWVDGWGAPLLQRRSSRTCPAFWKASWGTADTCTSSAQSTVISAGCWLWSLFLLSVF